MLVHICCSVDSHYFLKRLRETLPNERLRGFFYNPNIHPFEEYKLRLLDVQRSCGKYNIELFEGKYDMEKWLKAINGLEYEPERGKRCEECFKIRLKITAKKAKELNEKHITTTLFMSPKKSFYQLESAAKNISEEEGVQVFCYDFRKNGGTNEQFKLAREDKLYRQNYCGCIYALQAQREKQKRFATELISPIGREMMPCSAQEKTAIYEKIKEFEQKNQTFETKREKIEIFRLLWGRVLVEKKTVPSYFLNECFSGNFEIMEIKNGFGFAGENAVFVELEMFNKIAKTDYKSVKELIFNPPSYERQNTIKKHFLKNLPIAVLDKVQKTTYEIEAVTENYSDIMEVLAIL